MVDVSQSAESVAESGLKSTVLTFLIADLRGYTRFTDEHGDEAAGKLVTRFASVTEKVVGAREGQVIELRGDEALAVFSSARQALRAAVDLQQEFARATKADPSLPLKVGIGIDAGEAMPIKGGYRGAALNLAARLCSLAGPGETFASEGVVHLGRRMEGLAFVDRGDVRIKGLSDPVRVIQVAPEGELPEEPPPLQPLLVTPPTNLPDEPTPFVGREPRIAAISELLQRPKVRLVTLTGPGGAGKTRLAVQVGATLLHRFRDSVFFISLGSIRDPALVGAAIAETLGVKEEDGKPLLATLKRRLHDRQLVLILNNFEHVLDVSSLVASLLDACTELRFLVTSRISLRLAREHEYAVPPLSMPDLQNLPPLQTLLQYEALALFVSRAQAAKAGFALTDGNARAVAEICYRLDGLPLAIELAAARIRLFPPQALAARLTRRLQVLAGGPRDRPARQQTLRGAVDWSYDLLGERERTLFARLAVFAGGCTLEAAEAICNAGRELGPDVLDGMASLVEHSLVQQIGEAVPRLRMLETIREYAAERLAESGAADDVGRRHAAYFLELAEEAEPELEGPDQEVWLDRLDAERDNLRAALAWLLERGEIDLAYRLAGALRGFWMLRSHSADARERLEAVPAAGSAVSPSARAKVLLGASRFAPGVEQRTEILGEALALCRATGDRRGCARALLRLSGAARAGGDFALGDKHAEESLALSRGLGDRRLVAHALQTLGWTRYYRTEFEEAAPLFEESLRIAHDLGDRHLIAAGLYPLAWIAALRGTHEEAARLAEEFLAIRRQMGDREGVSSALVTLGYVALRQGDVDRAEALERESLRENLALGYTLSENDNFRTLEAMAAVAARKGEPRRAARLWGIAEAIRSAVHEPLEPITLACFGEDIDAARAQLGGAAWEAALQEGRAMTLEGAVAYALDGDASSGSVG
mgnify:CR=1 FL=1